MKFVSWLMSGAGTFLMWCGYTGRNPITTAVAAMQGKPLPAANSWMPFQFSDGVLLWVDTNKDGYDDQTGKPIPGELGESRRTGGGVVGGAIGGGSDGGSVVGGAIGGTVTTKRETVVAFARAQIGERYVFGAAGPSTWDCSGLTMRAYQQVGVALPHKAEFQQLRGTKVTSPSLGDIVFWGFPAYHCGIYSGNGNVINAPKPGTTVREQKIWDANKVTYRSYLK